MNHRMRRIVETLACERRYGIADAKGAEYSGKGSTYKETGADTLANFKNVAERIGGTPEQVLMTYLLKHIDSINTAVREAAQHNPAYVVFNRDPKTVYAGGEGIVSRLDDARNYLDLLECLLIDNGHIEPQTDGQGELYKQIGVGAAKSAERLDAPGLKPGQYPGVRFSTSAGNPNNLDLTTVRPEGFKTITEKIVDTPQQDAESDRILKEAGLVEGLDGVWRGKTKIDESVKNSGERQTPICYGETGELT